MTLDYIPRARRRAGRRHGGGVMGDMRKRFDAKWMPEPNGGCWLWTASIDDGGYGKFMVGSRTDGTNRMRQAHRVSYEIYVGPIPEGLQLDHLCRVRNCVNPAHLEPVTSAENTRRGETGKATGALNRAKTHCPQGHPYAGGNLYIKPAGWRGCRTCNMAAARRYQAKERQGGFNRTVPA